MLNDKMSVDEITVETGRHRSTMLREIKYRVPKRIAQLFIDTANTTPPVTTSSSLVNPGK